MFQCSETMCATHSYCLKKENGKDAVFGQVELSKIVTILNYFTMGFILCCVLWQVF